MFVKNCTRCWQKRLATDAFITLNATIRISTLLEPFRTAERTFRWNIGVYHFRLAAISDFAMVIAITNIIFFFQKCLGWTQAGIQGMFMKNAAMEAVQGIAPKRKRLFFGKEACSKNYLLKIIRTESTLIAFVRNRKRRSSIRLEQISCKSSNM